MRLQAVKAVTDGMSQVKAARVFGVTRQIVGRWVKARRQGGLAALGVHKRGPKGHHGRLDGRKAAQICSLIRDRDPEQLKLPFVLWTSDAVRLLIRRRFGINVSARSVRRYLVHWGFTPQKPRRSAYERDPEAVRRWLEEQYPAIRMRATHERARIYWGDEMGVRSDHQAGRSYAPRGCTPVTRGTGQRFGTNVISAITNRGHLTFMVFQRRFTAPVFLRFARRLVKQSGRKVFLIVDCHPVHRSRSVSRWLQAHVAQIEAFFLPGYSPDLNPDEMLNHDVKANAVGRRRPHNRPQLMRNVRSYLDRRRRKPELVQRYFHAKTVRYAA